MRHGYILNQNPLTFFGARRHYRGAAPYPVTFFIGDTWEELDASGNWIETWFWNGFFWLSTQVCQYHQSTPTSSNVASTYHYPLPVDNYDLFLVSLYATLLVNVAATATVNWGWTIRFVSELSGATQIATANNVGQPANTWRNFKTALSSRQAFLSPSKVVLQLAETRTGTISKQGGIGFEYRKCRR